MNKFEKNIEENKYNEMFSAIKRKVISARGTFYSNNINTVSFAELDDIHVMSVRFFNSNDRINSEICFIVTVQADIIISGKGRRDYEQDRTEKWYAVKFTANLDRTLENVKMISVDEYSKERFKKEDALTKYLAPYMYSDNLDSFATEFLEMYCPESLKKPIKLPVQEIIKSMGLSLYYAPLDKNIFGKTFFDDSVELVYGKFAELE
ncbi:MAG: hypothetical protein IK085_00180 [Clostridia bacterium]|nr:hypothetical protein [Clostridia bacterium]